MGVMKTECKGELLSDRSTVEELGCERERGRVNGIWESDNEK